METLIKVDPEKHMYRWYSVGIQSTLVDGIAVVYGWGSLKSSFQQWRIIKVESMEEAERFAEKMVIKKWGEGYRKEKTILDRTMMVRELFLKSIE